MMQRVVVCEMPAQPQWCEIRTTVFSGTPSRFPFRTRLTKKLSSLVHLLPIVDTAFWDVGHAPNDQSAHRKYAPEHSRAAETPPTDTHNEPDDAGTNEQLTKNYAAV